MKTLILTFLIFLAGTSFASAQSESTLLAEKEFLMADATLNETYKLVLSKLKTTRQRREVEAAQQAWQQFRKADAAALAGINSGGGSAYNMDYMANLAELSDERTTQLKQLLKMLGP